jgi:hypothetical protein
MQTLDQIQQINQSIMFGQFTNVQLDSIIGAVKYARAQLAKEKKQSLWVGDGVKFVSSRSGQYIVGNVEKINRKYIVVREKLSNGSVGMRWRVPANMLEAAE